MVTESKGRAWFGKIYNKLETILVEVDTFTSQNTLCLKSSDPSGWESVRSERKEVAEDRSSRNSNVQQHQDRVSLPSRESPSDPPSHQNFDISGNVRVEERAQGDSLKDNLSDVELLYTSPLLEEYCDGNLTSSATSLGDEEQIITNEELLITNTLTPQKISAGDPLVFPVKEMAEEGRVEGDSLKDNLSASSLSDRDILSTSPLLEEYCDGNLTSSATSLGDEEPIITDEKTQITNTLTPQKISGGDPLVFRGEEMSEEDRVESCRDVASTESPSTQSSLESFGTVSEWNDNLDRAAFEISTDDSNLTPLATKISDVPVQDNVENMRSYNADDVIDSKSDIALLDINALYGMYFQEVDDNALYAMRVRTKKLRSFKRKILDAFTSKRRREKEYEQLAIWFGDVDMGSDLATGEDSKPVEDMDFKSSQVLESEDFQWELL